METALQPRVAGDGSPYLKALTAVLARAFGGRLASLPVYGVELKVPLEGRACGARFGLPGSDLRPLLPVAGEAGRLSICPATQVRPVTGGAILGRIVQARGVSHATVDDRVACRWVAWSGGALIASDCSNEE